ncbi:hypothetical protein Lal_00013117 [Lupinus albus]|nr:hypothetical protein Lal_00013117 [Lupinus albus]
MPRPAIANRQAALKLVDEVFIVLTPISCPVKVRIRTAGWKERRCRETSPWRRRSVAADPAFGDCGWSQLRVQPIGGHGFPRTLRDTGRHEAGMGRHDPRTDHPVEWRARRIALGGAQCRHPVHDGFGLAHHGPQCRAYGRGDGDRGPHHFRGVGIHAGFRADRGPRRVRHPSPSGPSAPDHTEPARPFHRQAGWTPDPRLPHAAARRRRSARPRLRPVSFERGSGHPVHRKAGRQPDRRPLDGAGQPPCRGPVRPPCRNRHRSARPGNLPGDAEGIPAAGGHAGGNHLAVRLRVRVPAQHGLPGASGQRLAPEPGTAKSTTRGSILPGVTGPGAYQVSPRYGIIVAVNIETREAIGGWIGRLPVFFLLDLVLSGGGAALSAILYRQVTRRRRAMFELAEANAGLEQRVVERTAALQRSEERLTAFVSTARDAMLVVDGSGTIQFVNPAATILFGHAAEDLIGRTIDLLLPCQVSDLQDPGYFARHGMGERAGVRELMARHRSGVEFPVELTLGASHSDGETIYVGVLRDIRERKLQEERLWELANLDPLTGLLNRRAFMERGTALLEEVWRQGQPVSVLMIDADHFKSINDGFGHQAGDDVLRMLADILQTAVRSGDLLGRLGGEEFAIILPGADGPDADRIAERLLADVRQARVPVPGRMLAITISIGISVMRRRSTLDDLLATADQALYAAKTAGRDRRAVAA